MVRTTRSQEDVLMQAAQLVAGTINVSAMGITNEQVDVEQFTRLFKEKAIELLQNKDSLLLSIGPCINTDNNGIFSKDMQTIIESIESQTKTKFYFYYGILLWLGKNDLAANWLPH